MVESMRYAITIVVYLWIEYLLLDSTFINRYSWEGQKSQPIICEVLLNISYSDALLKTLFIRVLYVLSLADTTVASKCPLYITSKQEKKGVERTPGQNKQSFKHSIKPSVVYNKIFIARPSG